MVVLIPGVQLTGVVGTPAVQDVGGSTGDRAPSVSFHGSNSNETPMLYDGMRYAAVWSAGGGVAGIWVANAGTVDEMSIDTSGTTTNAEVGGININIIPKQGGNRFTAQFIGNYTNDSLQAGNLNADLIARGAPAPFVTKKIFDVNPTIGGPIVRDKVWFYGGYRYWGTTDQPPGSYRDVNPTDFVFTPGALAVNDTWSKQSNLRVTWQTSSKSKLAIYGDNNPRCWCGNGLNSLTAFEATTYFHGPRNNLFQATWNWTVTNRFLIEIGETFRPEGWTYDKQPSNSYDLPSILDTGTGVRFRAGSSHLGQDRKLAVSYVTGSHSYRVGSQWFYGRRNRTLYATSDTNYTFNNGAPSSLTLYATPYGAKDYLNMNLGLYAQDQYTYKRLTLNGGLRFDYLNAEIPDQHQPAIRYVGARDFPGVKNVPNWKDISPRLGTSYDLFGKGKTAIKGFVGKYLEGQAVGISEVVNPVLNNATTTRGWTDVNRNFTPDCDLRNPAAQDLSASGGDICGANANGNFGKGVSPVTYSPDVIQGWGKRAWNWEASASAQHELHQGLSVEGGYYRRWSGNFRVTDNILAAPGDYQTYCITAPVDARLPNSGQQICGLYDISQTKFGLTQNVVTFAKNFGKQTQVFEGLDVNLRARLPGGVTLQGGTSTGRVKTSRCFAVDSPGELRFCEVTPPFLTQIKAFGVYPFPWWGLQTSATFQSIPGPSILASSSVSNAQIVPSLGHNLSGGATRVTIPLLVTGQLYGERLYQVDLRVAKNFRFSASRRAQAQLDLYNALNGNAVTSQNNTYGTAWQQPVGILPGRIVKFGVQINF
jgi:hypothetical protein